MSQDISNHDDIIDSRDVIARIEDLANACESPCGYCGQEANGLPCPAEASCKHDEPLDEEEVAELAALRALASEAEGYASDWHHGEALIRDSYFEDYARDLAEDVCDMPSDLRWPLTCIDWAQAARELQQDYAAVDFGGVTYWVR